jgi:DNA gyrase subunit B
MVEYMFAIQGGSYMAKSQEYGNESIKSLKGADRVRKRPAVIFGSDGADGCAHSIFEIVSNSIDEARDGHGNRINVTLFADHSVQVEDFGRGIPVDYNNAEKRWNWDLVFCELYAGGKYAEGGGNYDFSLGLNGLGLCATQYASEWMKADIYRDGFHYHLEFKKGKNVGGLKKDPYTGRRTGSVICWKPDTDVFTDINVPASAFQDMLKRQAVVNAGVTLAFEDRSGEHSQKSEYFYEHGITDYANEIAGEDFLTPVHTCEGMAMGRDREDQPDYQVRMSVAFCFSNRVQLLEYYHNSSWLEHGGSPDRAVRLAFVNQINSWLKSKNLYKKSESMITFADVQDCLVLISSSFSTRTSYENQTKKAITNKFVAQAMTEFLKHQLEVYFIENPDEAEKACKQVLINKQSREHAEKARISIKKTMSAQMDLANRVQKFVDCRTKDVTRRELYIVEGDSAMGAVKTSRDSEFQAIMPVRGKILNCLKADYARIFKSDIITDLIRVLGCGVELGGSHNKELATFNLENLRFNKIVICTDADVDGYQIRTLILTMLYRLTPTLIQKGYVYIAESPLYEINTKDKTFFAYTEPEKANILKRIGSTKYGIQRSKGLGENDPDMMWLTTMNPQSRRLIKVMPTDVKQTAQVFDLLLGDDLPGRKEHIAQHGAEYLDDLDVS